MDSKSHDETHYGINRSVSTSYTEKTPFQDIERDAVGTTVSEKQETETTIRDPDIVDWEGPDDPENPMNWPLKKKVVATATISLITLLTYGSDLKSIPNSD